MPQLAISSDLSLPDDATTQKISFIGRTGAGKTFGAGKMIETMIDAGKQVVILDPVGVWYGLRMSADGATGGIEIPVLGGLHGDIPLETGAGAMVADLIVDKHLSLVLDVSQFESDADKSRFAEAWCSRLFFRKKAAPSAVHIVIEEAQEFIPQNPQRGEERMLHAFQRMWKLGRNFGIGGSLISQRPQEINKKALNQTELLFAFQMTGTHERKAIKEWMWDKGMQIDIAEELPALKVGQCFAWSPQWLRFTGKIVFAKKRTFNSSSTPTSGAQKRHEPVAIDMKDLAAKMAATIEAAKANDPTELKRELADVKKSRDLLVKQAQEINGIVDSEIGVGAWGTTFKTAPEGVRLLTRQLRAEKREVKEISIFNAEDRKAIMDMAESIRSLSGRTAEIINRACNQLEKQPIRTIASGPRSVPMDIRIGKPVNLRGTDSIRPLTPKEFSQLPSLTTSVTGATRRVMVAIAQRPGLSSRQIGVRSGVKADGSTYRAAMAALRKNAWLNEGGDSFCLNDAGLDALGEYEGLPTGRALLDYYLKQLPRGAADILSALSNEHPRPLGYEQLAQASGTAAGGSTMRAWMARLRALDLVEDVSVGQVKASDELF